jgi:outer membrane immunogenic protein
MIRLVSAALGVALCPMSTLAADLSQPAPPRIVPAPAIYDWTGLYVGAQTGWLFGDADAGFDIGEVILGFEPEGPVVGGHLGYNHQFGHFVAGVEADAEWIDADDSGSTLEDITAEGSIELNWQASIRARFGAAFDRVLIYGTAGVAFVDADLVGGPVGGPLTAFDDSAWGGTVGAGVEAAITRRLLARVEYRYSNFRDLEGDLSIAPGLPALEESADLDTHAIRAAVSWKF